MMELILSVMVCIVMLFGLIVFLKKRPVKSIPVDQMLDEVVSKYCRYIQAPAIAIGVYKNGKILFKNIGDSVTENSIFQIGSLSKLFTTSCFQILVDEKKISYSSSIADILTYSEIDLRVKKITLLSLATHTSGFPSVPKLFVAHLKKQIRKDEFLVNPYSYFNKQLMIEYLKNPLDINGKNKFEYSNYGMGLLGYLLAEKNQTSFEVLIEQTILKPLNVSNSFISKQGLNTIVNGFTTKGKPTPPWTFGALEGAGAFNASSGDMMKFIIANLDPHSPLFNFFVKTHERQKNGKTGIGWMQPSVIDKLMGNASMVWHNGMVGGFASYLAIDKKERTGVVFLSNHSIDVTFVGATIMRRLKKTVLS